MKTSLCRCVIGALALVIVWPPGESWAILVATEPWVRPAARGQSTEAYVQLTSTEGAALLGARCTVAASIELRPRATARAASGELQLPAGKEVVLAPKSGRLVLHGLTQTLKVGDRVAITLIVARKDGTRQEIPLDAEVRLNSPTDDHRRGHRH